MLNLLEAHAHGNAVIDLEAWKSRKYKAIILEKNSRKSRAYCNVRSDGDFATWQLKS